MLIVKFVCGAGGGGVYRSPPVALSLGVLIVKFVCGAGGGSVYRSLPVALSLRVLIVKFVCGAGGGGVYRSLPVALSFGVLIVKFVCGSARAAESEPQTTRSADATRANKRSRKVLPLMKPLAHIPRIPVL